VTTVLLIEDDDDVRLLVRLLLRPHADLELVAEAPRTEDAMDLALGPGPDVVILDHHLAGGRFGLEAAPDLKARWPAARIVLFSAVDLQERAAASPAIDGYVRKDDLHSLVPCVQRLAPEPVAI
jgi:DNA-binding NarL/FixJ family response regulator